MPANVYVAFTNPQNKRMTENQIAQRGIEAARLLESEVYQDAMGSLKKQVIESWKDCPVRDREGQLLLLQLAKLTDKFESILTGMIESGKYSQHKLNVDEVRNESAVKRFARKVVNG